MSAILLNFPFDSFVQKSKGSVELADGFSYCTNKQDGRENFFQFSIFLHVYLLLKKGRGASTVTKPSKRVLRAPAQACEQLVWKTLLLWEHKFRNPQEEERRPFNGAGNPRVLETPLVNFICGRRRSWRSDKALEGTWPCGLSSVCNPGLYLHSPGTSPTSQNFYEVT